MLRSGLCACRTGRITRHVGQPHVRIQADLTQCFAQACALAARAVSRAMWDNRMCAFRLFIVIFDYYEKPLSIHDRGSYLHVTLNILHHFAVLYHFKEIQQPSLLKSQEALIRPQIR